MQHLKQVVVLVGAVLVASGGSASVAGEQGTACPQPLATVTVPERSYAMLNVKEFDGRVYLYAPEIQSTSRGTFEAFELWVVEGVYGRPFVQPTGAMDHASFERLRKSTNVRATGTRVSRSPESRRVTIARQPYVIEVAVRVSSGGSDTLSARVCRAR